MPGGGGHQFAAPLGHEEAVVHRPPDPRQDGLALLDEGRHHPPVGGAGDEVEVLVKSMETADGLPVLSRADAVRMKAWEYAVGTVLGMLPALDDGAAELGREREPAILLPLPAGPRRDASSVGLAMAMALIGEGPAKQAGVAVGEQAALAVIAAGGIDPAVEQQQIGEQSDRAVLPGREQRGRREPAHQAEQYVLTEAVTPAEYAKLYPTCRVQGCRDDPEPRRNTSLLAMSPGNPSAGLISLPPPLMFSDAPVSRIREPLILVLL